MIILAIYNCVELPLELAFFIQIDKRRPWVDTFIDVCFGIDILISFRSTYLNEYTGDEIFDEFLIAKNYCFGRFWLDILSTLPFEVIINWLPIKISAPEHYKLVSCLKLFRILRLGRLINYINSTQDFKMILRLIKLCFFLVLYIHIFGCMWFFFNKISGKQWVPAQYETY